MERPFFSVICVYNNKILLEDLLLPSLEIQTEPHERIFIDNTNSQYLSAALALNQAAAKAGGRYLIFIHQDVALLSNKWLAQARLILEGIEGPFGMAGPAGVIRHFKGGRSNGVNGLPVQWMGRRFGQKILPTLSVDEFLMIVAAQMFKKYKFDEKTCDGWDLYGVDYCYNMAGEGFSNFILPLPVYHASEGLLVQSSFSERFTGYFFVLEKLLKKHRKSFFIAAMTGVWATWIPLRWQRLYYIFKFQLRKFLRKII